MEYLTTEAIRTFLTNNNMRLRNVVRESDSEEEVSESDVGIDGDEEVEDETKGDGLLIESDSDDEPEDIGFVTSRATSLQHVKDVMQQIGKTKQQKKEKQKHLDEKFREQKKKKVERLKDSRLPDSVLDEVASRPRLTMAVVPNKRIANEGKTTNNDTVIPSDEHDSEADDEDYIPINKDATIQAVTFQDVLKLKQNHVQDIASFREQRLYGRHINRQSVKDKLQQRTKRAAARQSSSQKNKRKR